VNLSEHYAKYSKLELSCPADGVLQIVLRGHGRANALDAVIHRELAEIWRDVDADPAIRVAIVRGPGDAFAAGGDVSMVATMGKDWEKMAGGWKEARDSSTISSTAPSL
jgi:enoyl-CoA hydratase